MDKWKRVSLCFGLVSLILVVSLGYVLYSYAVSPTSTYFISSGIYPSAFDWTIWTEDGNFFAKNANGQLVYSGTDATGLLNNVTSTLPTVEPYGGSIYVKNGVYGINAPILLPSGCILIGESMHSTIFRATVGGTVFDGGLLRGKASAWVEVGIQIKNLMIDGAGLASGGIFLTTYRGLVDHVWVFNTTSTAIQVSGWSGSQAIENIVQNCVLEYNGFCGINVAGYAPDNYIWGNTISHPTSSGIRSVNWDTWIKNNHVYAAGYAGVAIEASLCHVEDNYVEGSTSYGIWLGTSGGNEAHNNTVSGNILDNSQIAGLVLSNSNFNVINANTMGTLYGTPVQISGLNETGTSNYNLIVACSAIGNTAVGIATLGAQTQVHSCFNGTSWIV